MKIIPLKTIYNNIFTNLARWMLENLATLVMIFAVSICLLTWMPVDRPKPGPITSLGMVVTVAQDADAIIEACRLSFMAGHLGAMDDENFINMLRSSRGDTIKIIAKSRLWLDMLDQDWTDKKIGVNVYAKRKK